MQVFGFRFLIVTVAALLVFTYFTADGSASTIQVIPGMEFDQTDLIQPEIFAAGVPGGKGCVTKVFKFIFGNWYIPAMLGFGGLFYLFTRQQSES